MIAFHLEFIAIEGHSGYFWNCIDKQVYSCKIDGVLKPLKMIKRIFYPPHYNSKIIKDYNRKDQRHWSLCHKGVRTRIFREDLIKLKPSTEIVSYFPIKK